MADADYIPFHYTQIYKVGLLGRAYQAECACGWKGDRCTTHPGAASQALLHLLGERLPLDGEPTEELQSPQPTERTE